jgi:hypothetical protein
MGRPSSPPLSTSLSLQEEDREGREDRERREERERMRDL